MHASPPILMKAPFPKIKALIAYSKDFIFPSNLQFNRKSELKSYVDFRIFELSFNTKFELEKNAIQLSK